MFCPECGAENPQDAVFCGECGCDIQKELQKEKAASEEKIPEKKKAVPKEKIPEKRKAVSKEKISEKKEEKTTSKNEKTVIIALFAVIIVVAAFFAWQMISGRADNKKEQSKASEATTEAKTVTEEETESTEATTEESDENLPSIISQSAVDYDNILDLDDYETFYAGDYSFGYPKELYESVVQVGDSYEFQSDEYNHVTYSREKLDSGVTAKKKLKSLYSQVRGNLTDRNEVLYIEDNGIFVIAGRSKDDSNQSIYNLVRIENGYVYSMTIGYRYTSDKTETNKQNYYIDTMYRLCSFGRGTYKPRTYQQFLNDDMGTKK